MQIAGLFYYICIMEALLNLCDRVMKLNINDILFDIFNRFEVQWFVIELNTKEQLFKRGIDSKENSLGEYSPYTIELKQDAGLPYDRITLYDKGDFYESFEVRSYRTEIEIDANPLKIDEDDKQSNLFEDFGIEIIGLTKENIEKLQNYLLPLIIEELRKTILNY